ncbi:MULTISPECIES: hypothetical protein [unclassified Micromonospora]|uniref:hypothetical protein n=1 Tax=unclassified Micromonospora TaxID=2617518 RepID=UPI0022B6F566|nr:MULTISPECIES: hypothetical protein [unclassified Micromonospora]MCZ7420704.1 hypothetical protein [Verrucosispora sp. WMMA2121]WBB88845.1 hypothetical protein O7597_17525 [Verrucosispora sp. WMMC514]
MTDPYPSQQPHQVAAPASPNQQDPPTELGHPQPPMNGWDKRSKLPAILAVASMAVALIAVAVAALVWVSSRDSLTLETAQRECRTALEREAKRRAGQAGPDGILVSLNDVELQESWETDSGFAVNGAARYTLTSTLLPQVSQSVSLTCEATTVDGQVVTTVKNRL